MLGGVLSSSATPNTWPIDAALKVNGFGALTSCACAGPPMCCRSTMRSEAVQIDKSQAIGIVAGRDLHRRQGAGKAGDGGVRRRDDGDGSLLRAQAGRQEEAEDAIKGSSEPSATAAGPAGRPARTGAPARHSRLLRHLFRDRTCRA